jgi:NADPH:quinone reductase-like Zn-dependent oxidoreductase
MKSTEVRAVDRGTGPESLALHTIEVGDPPPGQVRVQVEAAGTSYGDLLFQRGVVPGGPKPPFVPGCDLTGTVEAVGSGVTGLSPGQRVTALVRSGGYATMATVPADRLVAVPEGVNPVEVAASALNYFIAHQMLHRVARVRSGDRILVHGASGGVGVAFLQLTEHIGGVHVWGTCSARNADLVRELGATPIDYRGEDFVNVIKASGARLDAVFDHIGGTQFWRSYSLLRRGGRLVAYGQNDALRGGKPNPVIGAIGFLGGIAAPKLLPDRRSTTFYNAWALEKSHPHAYREDLSTLLELIAAGKIAPRSVTVLPLREAREAFRTLEEGAQSKIVLDMTA